MAELGDDLRLLCKKDEVESDPTGETLLELKMVAIEHLNSSMKTMAEVARKGQRFFDSAFVIRTVKGTGLNLDFEEVVKLLVLEWGKTNRVGVSIDCHFSPNFSHVFLWLRVTW